MSKNVAVVGAGNMGTALAQLLAGNGYNVLLWDVNPEVVRTINVWHENKFFLAGVPLPKTVTATESLEETVRFSDVLFLAVPSQHLRATLKKVPKELIDHELIVNCAKGVELTGFSFMTEVIAEVWGPAAAKATVDLSGPSIANELMQKRLTAVTVAGKNEALLKKLEKILQNNYFRLRPSSDLRGVELGGVMKNVYSMGVGMVDVLSPSMNTRSLLLTHALAEMAALGATMKCERDTFYGLSGIGDLIATCLSEHSRNRKLGRLLARGMEAEAAQKEVGQVTEGYFAAKALQSLARKHKVTLPVADAIYKIAYLKKEPERLLDVLKA